MRFDERELARAEPGGEGEIDFAVMGRALWSKRHWIVWPTVAAAVLSTVIVNVLTPKYKSESRVLIEGRESVFVRPEADKSGDRDRATIDQEAVQSQVQVVLSRDLALQVAKKLKLNERPEFDPVLRGGSLLRSLLTLLGLARDPLRMTPEERMLENYYARIVAYSVDKSRVIAIEFQSEDSELAARAANTIAETYLSMQQAAKLDQTRAAGKWLAGEIEVLRQKVFEAESRAETYRAKSNLLVGINGTTLSNQQLGELNSQLSLARSQKADAEARSRLIRDLLRRGGSIEASDILNSELIRRLGEQRATLLGQLAEQSSTLLGQHPRIKELRAQVGDIERQLRVEAEKIARALENDARIAGSRMETLSANLDQLKRQAASTNDLDVQLRAFDREAKAQRELLEAYLGKYREATARDSLGAAPGDARVISRATISTIPAFPKKLPIVLVATLAIFILTSGFILAGELMSATAKHEASPRMQVVDSRIDRAGPSLDDGHQESEPVAVRARRPIAATRPSLAPLSVHDEAMGELEVLTRAIEGAPAEERMVAVVGAQEGLGADVVALTLARLLAGRLRVVLVELSLGSPRLSAWSSDPAAPGLVQLVRDGAAFSRVLTRDRGSRAHLVIAGGVASDRNEMWMSERLGMAMNALARSYDVVILEAGMVGSVEGPRLAQFATRAVLVTSDRSGSGTVVARERLAAAGFQRIDLVSQISSDALVEWPADAAA